MQNNKTASAECVFAAGGELQGVRGYEILWPSSLRPVGHIYHSDPRSASWNLLWTVAILGEGPCVLSPSFRHPSPGPLQTPDYPVANFITVIWKYTSWTICGAFVILPEQGRILSWEKYIFMINMLLKINQATFNHEQLSNKQCYMSSQIICSC